MNVGGYPATPARQPGLRAAVNAWLEEISFRTGLISAAIALVALVAITAAAFYAATAGQGSAAVVVSADNVPKTAPKAPVPAALPSSALPSSATALPSSATAVSPPATAKPTARQAAAADTTSQSPAVAPPPPPQPQVPATASATAGPQRYGYPGYGQPGYGYPATHGSGQRFDGGGFQHEGPGFPGFGGFSGYGRGRDGGR